MKEINAWNALARLIRISSANVFADFADVFRGPSRKDDRNGGERREGDEQRVVDGGIGWLEAVTDTAGRGDEEGGRLAWVDLRGGGGGQFFPFLSEGKSGSPRP